VKQEKGGENLKFEESLIGKKLWYWLKTDTEGKDPKEGSILMDIVSIRETSFLEFDDGNYVNIADIEVFHIID